jgi:hypothetical protein
MNLLSAHQSSYPICPATQSVSAMCRNEVRNLFALLRRVSTTENPATIGPSSMASAQCAAVSYVMAQLELLAEETEHAERNDTAYRAELVALRATIELDRFGIVAHALSRRDGCTVERCDALMRLHDTSHVLANMSDRIFDEQVAKYAASWNSPSHPGPAEAAGPAVAVVAPAAPIATNPTNPNLWAPPARAAAQC